MSQDIYHHKKKKELLPIKVTMSIQSDPSNHNKNNGFAFSSILWNRRVTDLLFRRTRTGRRRTSSKDAIITDCPQQQHVEEGDSSNTTRQEQQQPHETYYYSSKTISILDTRDHNDQHQHHNHYGNNRKKKVSIRKIRRSLHNDEVEELSITGRRLKISFVRSIEQYSPLSTLSKLILNRNQLYRDKSAFKRLLSNIPIQIEELSLCWNGLDEQCAIVLSNRLKELSKLKSISLAGNPIGPTGIQSLIEEGNLHHVSNVNLSDCDVGDEGVATLGCYIQLQSSKISNLKLDMNAIGDIGMVALSQGLKSNQSLQELDLYCNDFGELGVKTLMSAISSTNNPHHISSSSSSKLHTLSLRANRIHNNGAKIIAKKLNRCTSLRSLNIGYNEIGDEGGMCLAEAMGRNKTLRELKMSWNHLGNKSISSFATALTHNESLEVCLLDENQQVGRRGASTFVKTLQLNTTLKKLEILNRSYENHLLNDKIDYLVKANKYGRHHIGDLSINIAAWPRILERMNDDPQHIYMFLQERPDILLLTATITERRDAAIELNSAS